MVSTTSIREAIATYNTSPAQSTVEDVNQALRRAPVVMARLALQRVHEMRPLILKDAKTSDRRPDHPFLWSLNKTAQRNAQRWWFANLPQGGKGAGRYRRTGGMDKATRVVGAFTIAGGQITIRNDRPGAEFVFGNRQVPAFIRVHPYFGDVAAKWRSPLSDGLREDWYTATHGTGTLR